MWRGFSHFKRPVVKYCCCLVGTLTNDDKLLHKIVYTNSIVAISTGVLTAGFCYASEVDNWLYYGMFALLSTFAVYNGQRLIKSGQIQKTPWLNWVKKNTRVFYLWVVASSFGALSMLFIIQHFSLTAMALLAVMGLISLLYVVPIKGRNMREFAHLKIHLIAICWSGVLILFPVMNEGANQESHYWIALAHYAYIIGVTIPFDIRDLKFDASSQQTIPQVVGVWSSKAIALTLLIIFAGLMIWQNEPLGYNPLFFLAVFVQMLLILFMNERRGDLYCAGGIDGAIALLGLSYFF
jgi:hypothetical protein